MPLAVMVPGEAVKVSVVGVEVVGTGGVGGMSGKVWKDMISDQGPTEPVALTFT